MSMSMRRLAGGPLKLNKMQKCYGCSKFLSVEVWEASRRCESWICVDIQAHAKQLFKYSGKDADEHEHAEAGRRDSGFRKYAQHPGDAVRNGRLTFSISCDELHRGLPGCAEGSGMGEIQPLDEVLATCQLVLIGRTISIAGPRWQWM